MLQNAAGEWHIDTNDMALTSDNAANMLVAADLGKFVHVKCFAHTVNLASQRALKLPLVVKLLGNIRRVSTFFHRSANGKYQLEEKQKLHGRAKPKKFCFVSNFVARACRFYFISGNGQ